MNESWPHIYKKPAEPHCPLQVVPEEVIGTTHRSRDYSVWESDTLHWDSRQHCTGRSLLPKGWATLAVPAWLTTRIAITPNERVCQQFRIIVPTYCGANSALIATWWELHSWWQSVPVCPLVHSSARYHFVPVLLTTQEPAIKGGFYSPGRPVLAWETSMQQELY